MSQGVARDARGVSHGFRHVANKEEHPYELLTFCGTRGRLRHQKHSSWWNPLVMELMPGQVDCMACLVAEARR